MIDSHCHLSLLSPPDQDSYLESTKDFAKFHVMGGYDVDDWQSQRLLKEKNPDKIRTCFGIHPWALRKLTPDQFEDMWRKLKEMADDADLIGETGLDTFVQRTATEEDKEIDSFHRHLNLAQDLEKPVALHVVQDHGRALSILKNYPKVRGLVHAFTGSLEVAQDYVRLGYLVSLGPALLNPRFKKVQTVAMKLPLNSILIESDQPGDAKDTPQVNLLSQVYSTVAKIRGLALTQVESQVEKNILSLLKT